MQIKYIEKLKEVKLKLAIVLVNTTSNNIIDSMWDSNLKDFQKEKFDYFLINDATYPSIHLLCYENLGSFESEEAELQAKIIAATEYPSKLLIDIRNQWENTNNRHYSEKLKRNVCTFFLDGHISYLKQREQKILAIYYDIKSNKFPFHIDFTHVSSMGPYYACMVFNHPI